MDLSQLTVASVITFVLILTRISGMFLAAPLFNGQFIRNQIKIGTGFTMAIILFPFYSAQLVVPTDLIQLVVMAGQELILGLLLGFMANLLFSAVQMAGEYISFQMGLSVASVLDPISGIQVPALGSMYYYFAALIFLSMNIHHALIAGVNISFKHLPLGHFISDFGTLSEKFVVLTGDMFVLAVLVAIPVMGILLITEISLGFMAKVMPQMNIFMVSLPLKVGIGVLIFGISMPYVAQLLGDQYAELVQRLLGLYRTA